MHAISVRTQALDLLRSGMSRREVCRRLGVSYNSTYRWQARLEPAAGVAHASCFRCLGTGPPAAPYCYLLGQYLGDGHLAMGSRAAALRIYCTTAYPAITSEVSDAMRSVMGVSVNYRDKGGCVQVQSATNHWKCLFPQHGPGMKHTRPIVLADWQRELVAADPRPLVRGLIHSDGCRATNIIEHRLPSGIRIYAYPRYFFSNESADIRGILTDALDLLGIAWRQNRRNSISVARAEAVEALDEFVGPKS